jgi:cytochrome c oxidase subunit 3
MAATHAKHHDYHLVNPSPWPLTASISVLFMAIGLIIWMRSMSGGAGLFGAHGPWVFIVGFTGVAATAFMWWRDVIREGVEGDHTPVVQLHFRYGMILFIASEVMFFVACRSVPRRRARPSELDRRRRHGHPRPAHRRPLAAAAR